MRHICVFSQVHLYVEQWVRIAPFLPAPFQVVLERLRTGFGNIAIFAQIPIDIKESVRGASLMPAVLAIMTQGFDSCLRHVGVLG
jgi:hypothetical protein